MLVARGLQWGIAGFETDFTGTCLPACAFVRGPEGAGTVLTPPGAPAADFQSMAFPQAQASVGVYEAWLGGMDAALAEAGVPLQLCMGLPNDALLSVQVRCGVGSP